MSQVTESDISENDRNLLKFFKLIEVFIFWGLSLDSYFAYLLFPSCAQDKPLRQSRDIGASFC